MELGMVQPEFSVDLELCMNASEGGRGRARGAGVYILRRGRDQVVSVKDRVRNKVRTPNILLGYFFPPFFFLQKGRSTEVVQGPLICFVYHLCPLQ